MPNNSNPASPLRRTGPAIAAIALCLGATGCALRAIVDPQAAATVFAGGEEAPPGAVGWRSYGVPPGEAMLFPPASSASLSMHRIPGASGVTAPAAASARVLARGPGAVLVAADEAAHSSTPVQALGGDAMLAPGQKVAVTGRAIEGIRLEVRAPAQQPVNLGRLQGDPVAIFAAQLRHSGQVQAGSAKLVDGKVVLEARQHAATAAGDGAVVGAAADGLVLKPAVRLAAIAAPAAAPAPGDPARDAYTAAALDGVQLKAAAALQSGRVTVAMPRAPAVTVAMNDARQRR